MLKAAQERRKDCEMAQKAEVERCSRRGRQISRVGGIHPCCCCPGDVGAHVQGVKDDPQLTAGKETRTSVLHTERRWVQPVTRKSLEGLPPGASRKEGSPVDTLLAQWDHVEPLTYRSESPSVCFRPFTSNGKCSSQCYVRNLGLRFITPFFFQTIITIWNVMTTAYRKPRLSAYLP